MLRSSAVRAAALAFVLAFTTFALRPLPAAAVDAETLPIGSQAPLFESEDPDGTPFALAEAIKQKPVLLVFWSLFCGSCMEELPILEQERPKYVDKVQFIAVNLDEAPRARNVKQVAKQRGFTFPLLLNKVEKKAADGTVTKKEFQIDTVYKIKATPAVYLINSDGTIAYGHFGPLNPDELADVIAKAK